MFEHMIVKTTIHFLSGLCIKVQIVRKDYSLVAISWTPFTLC